MIPSFLCAITVLGFIPDPPVPTILIGLPFTISAGPKLRASFIFFSFKSFTDSSPDISIPSSFMAALAYPLLLLAYITLPFCTINPSG